jgi:hypothetical protein
MHPPPALVPGNDANEETDMMATELDLTADVIDVRDIIARVEELESERDDYMVPNRDGHMTMIGADWAADNAAEAAELDALLPILDELSGNGGDEQWQGAWYPGALIRDSYFTDYARDLLEDCGDLPRNLPHYIEIDWDATARNIRVDYTPVEIDGITYWYR